MVAVGGSQLLLWHRRNSSAADDGDVLGLTETTHEHPCYVDLIANPYVSFCDLSLCEDPFALKRHVKYVELFAIDDRWADRNVNPFVFVELPEHLWRCERS